MEKVQRFCLELKIGTKLFDTEHKYVLTVVNIFYNIDGLPLSKLDTEGTNAYEIEYFKSLNFGSKTFWATLSELQQSKIRLATEAEIVLYGKG